MAVSINIGTSAKLVGLTCGSANPAAQQCRHTTQCVNLVVICHIYLGLPVRTLTRRIDGAFPSVINPVAIWEVKEYYHTTTFGSRVADGVYETLLDGMELEELNLSEKIHIRHYLILDDEFTWWQCGRSHLCRIIDMMHMGYVDEVLFGREIVERIPILVTEWIDAASSKGCYSPATANRSRHV